MTSIPEIVSDLLGKVERLGIRYAIGGSYASSLWGLPRQTHDVDLSIEIDEAKIDPLIALLDPDFLISVSEIRHSLGTSDEYRMFQAIHMQQLLKLDFFVVSTSPYDQAKMSRRRQVSLSKGETLWFYSPEDIILHKLRWYELGRRASDRQFNDVVQIIEVQGHNLDRQYLNQWAEHFGIGFLLGEAEADAR